MHLNEHIEDLAKEAVGNWKKFESFGWHDRPEDEDSWCIIYTHNRDSGLLDESNASVINKELEPFTVGDSPDAISQRHGHWGHGWLEGYAIRVYDSAGNITEAFKTYAELKLALDEYPCLDDSDYSQREYDATITNIENEGPTFCNVDNPPEDWPSKVFSWLWENHQRSLESCDDQGGYPHKDDICKALDDLGIEYDRD